MKKFLVIFAVIVILVLAGWFFVSHPESIEMLGLDGNKAPQTITYACNNNKKITATFFKGESKPATSPNLPPTPGGSVSLKLSGGRFVAIPQTISADGTRYATEDESFIFWSKGNGALVLENNEEKTFIGCVRVADVPEESNLTEIYVNGTEGFSIRYPEGYSVNTSHAYQLAPGKKIAGVAFTIPPPPTEGPNLSSDTYISIESIPQTDSCTANIFLDGIHPATEKTQNDVTYSVATSSNAGLGSRYEETIYAIPGTNPCIAIRYVVHYTVIENYDPGTTPAFDKDALLLEFDAIRSTLILDQGRYNMSQG